MPRPLPVPPALTQAPRLVPQLAPGLAQAYLAAGIPLSLLIDLAAADDLDSAEILAVEQAAALARAESVRAAAERAMTYPTKGESSVA